MVEYEGLRQLRVGAFHHVVRQIVVKGAFFNREDRTARQGNTCHSWSVRAAGSPTKERGNKSEQSQQPSPNGKSLLLRVSWRSHRHRRRGRTYACIIAKSKCACQTRRRELHDRVSVAGKQSRKARGGYTICHHMLAQKTKQQRSCKAQQLHCRSPLDAGKVPDQAGHGVKLVPEQSAE